MTDIIIYTKKETAEHKIHSKYPILYWTFTNRPRNFEEGWGDGDRVFFAYDGAIRGFFESTLAFADVPENAVKFERRSWKKLSKPVQINPFPGFKYADKVPELSDIVAKLYK